MRKIFLFIAVFNCLFVAGQIVDDSTQNVYGPNTTLYTTYEDVLNNLDSAKRLDTTLFNIEKQSLVDRTNYHYQNLGNFGTAAYSVFHEPQPSIGRSLGFNAYRHFFVKPEDIKYYDTKSPFIDLLALLGGNNRNMVNVLFSRNVNPNWNIGFDYRNITSDKQIANTREGDRQVVGTKVDIYTHYKNQKVPYQLLGAYINNNHNVVEVGGVRFGNNSLLSDYFRFRNALPRLNAANNTMKNRRFFIYHDYILTDQLQVYHTFNYEKEQFIYQDFIDPSSSNNYNTYTDFYDNFLIDTDSTHERYRSTAITNEAGIKGAFTTIAYYRFYAKLRSIDADYFLLDPLERTTEEYLGAYARINWRDKFQLTGKVEFLFGGAYKFVGKLNSSYLNLTYMSMRYNVPIIFNQYFGNHFEWSNSFNPVLYNAINGGISLRWKIFDIQPKVRVATYTNQVYFDESIRPVQSSSGAILSSIGGDFNIILTNKKEESFHLRNEVYVSGSLGNGQEAVRMPPIFYNGKLFWDGKLFKDKVPIQFGVNAHAQSAYFANAYHPAIQQYHVQNEQDIFSYLRMDLFFNLKLDKFFLTVKWVHFDEPSDLGYFVTPFYPGNTQSLDIMVRWLFFD